MKVGNGSHPGNMLCQLQSAQRWQTLYITPVAPFHEQFYWLLSLKGIVLLAFLCPRAGEEGRANISNERIARLTLRSEQ